VPAPAWSITTRLGTEGDADRVIQLVRRCIDDMSARGIDQWDELYPNADTVLSDLRARTLHVASLDAAPLVGTFTLDTNEDPRWAVAEWSLTGMPVGVVHRLMVDPQYQGRGIARALMEIAESHARSLGLGVIRLDCFSENPQALRLYAGLGYRDAGGAQLRKGLFRCLEKRL
jgi:GNAT superfamily N-acetyltransferase